MKRLTEAWFEFNGIRSDPNIILLRTMPTRTVPGRTYTRKPVGGRDGNLAYGDGKYKDAKVKLECSVPNVKDVTHVLQWLSGHGLLRFSDEPSLAYEASVETEFSRSSISNRMEGQRFTITFTCAPFRKLYPESDPIIIQETGKIITNPGTATALPRVEIHGRGDFSLTIGMETLFFTGINNGIIVDSELMDAFDLDGAALLNDHFTGMPYEIQPGMNTVSWLLDNGASIERVVITPRWRYL